MEIIFRILTEDIESINVLKGAAASALYGESCSWCNCNYDQKGNPEKMIDGELHFLPNSAGFVDKSTFPKYQNMYGAGYNEDLRQVTVNGKKVWVPPFASDAL